MTLDRSLLLDLLAAAVLLIFLLRGGKRGLIKSLSGLVRLLAGFIGGRAAADTLSPLLAEKYVLPAVLKAAGQLGDSTAPLAESAAPLLQSVEQSVSEILSHMPMVSLSAAPLARSLSAMLEGQEEALTSALADRIAWILVFIISFLLLQLVAGLALTALDRLFSLPIIGFPNRVGGALLGLAVGAIMLAVALWALILFVPSLSAEGGWLSAETLESTRLLHTFATLVDSSIV